MSASGDAHSVENMNKIKFLPWPLILGLAALALVRPVVSIVESQLDVSAPPAVPIAITVAISAVWIIVVGLTKRARHPVLTLLLTGLTYAVLSIALSGILSPILTGELQGPLAMPLAIIPVLLTNAIWGLITGTLALLLQRSRSHRSSARTSRHAAPPAARL